jgi:hypothetical protein
MGCEISISVLIILTAAGRIFRGHKELWNSTKNTWVERNINWDDSGGEADSDVERIYCAVKFDRDWDAGLSE